MFNATDYTDEGIFQCFADNGYGVAASVKVNFREAKLARFSYESERVNCFQDAFIFSILYMVLWYHIKICHVYDKQEKHLISQTSTSINKVFFYIKLIFCIESTNLLSCTSTNCAGSLRNGR